TTRVVTQLEETAGFNGADIADAQHLLSCALYLLQPQAGIFFTMVHFLITALPLIYFQLVRIGRDSIFAGRVQARARLAKIIVNRCIAAGRDLRLYMPVGNELFVRK